MTLPALLLTRPAPQSQRFAAELARRCSVPFRTVIAPVLRIDQFAPEPLPADVAGLVMTSQHAVDRVTPGLPVWCVGERTAERARAAGHDVRGVAPDAARLVPLLVSAQPATPLLHLRGVHVREHLADLLGARGLPTRERVVYDQVPVALNDAARALLQQSVPLVVPLFSPRSARLLADQIAAVRGGLKAQLLPVAISAAAAATWAELAPETPVVAARPDGEAMAAACESALVAGSAA
ncbi:uroporphyrinogen-III synthase [Plastorhodobacter daqingensis]|uniref:Uroporphyrinogen-III synthase n=1 Tax=Plastorhodobacter daqingensis TaxID=1387281 RepID=A0ABW2UD16_9RHOB